MIHGFSRRSSAAATTACSRHIPRPSRASMRSSRRSRRSPTRRSRPRPRSSRIALRDGETLDDLLPGSVRRRARGGEARRSDMRHFDVQLIGGMVLHDGKIAEMRTGEGKTLVATLPAYLNALTGKGVHIVTVNDYLAQRDADWMGKVYRFLGLTVGVDPVADAARGEARRLRRRHHLRHQQRVRLRLPARQHGDAASRSASSASSTTRSSTRSTRS